MDIRTYESAVTALNGLQSNASIIKELNANRANLFKSSIPEMVDYLEIIGYKPSQLDHLKFIHITGTKGKGSTAAFCQSILKAYPIKNIKTGLFTSPHMQEVRERIRIDGKPLSQSKFTQYFYYCYDRLIKNKSNISLIHPHLPGPSYFRFLTLMCFHAFYMEKVDTAILEVGIGGEYDSTNVISQPLVCGISHLGLDHCNLLGHTVEEIAWHKAGIFKTSALGFTVKNQPIEAMKVVKERSIEKKIDLNISKPLNEYTNYKDIKLGLNGTHQEENASLAISLSLAWLKLTQPNFSSNSNTLSDYVLNGLANTKWPGRSHHYYHSITKLNYYLDGAHTLQSIQACIDWFHHQYNNSIPTFILFNPANGRDSNLLMETMINELNSKKIKIDGLILCPNIIGEESKVDSVNNTVDKDNELSLQYQLKDLWLTLRNETKLNNDIEPKVFNNINEAINYLNDITQKFKSTKDGKAQILVTGSLHLVGGVMNCLDHPIV